MNPEETTQTTQGTVGETPASSAGAATSETGAAASSDSATATSDKPDSMGATPVAETGQMAGNEPIIESPPQDPASPAGTAASSADITASSADMATSSDSAKATSDKESRIRELLEKARFAIQIRKRKKMEKIMGLFQKSSQVTNDDVEKLLHVSDSTAERYLNILEKEGKIRRVGSGRGAHYTLAS